MALLLMEGFESRDNAQRLYWSKQFCSFTAGRFGGNCVEAGGNLVINMPVAASTVIVGFAAMLQTNQGLDAYFMTPANQNPQARLFVRASDRFATLERGSGTATLATSTGAVMPALTWAWVEIKCRLADVGGLFEMRINGTVVVSYTGDTMQYSGESNITKIELQAYRIDDLYICDDTGTEFNDYLGEIQIETLVPNGNGTFSQLAGSDGNSVDNYLLVDELPGVETDYAQSAVVGQRDTYNYTNPTIASGQILAVQPEAMTSKANAGAANVKIVERLANGTERVGPAKPVSNLAWQHDGPKTRDPQNAAWTVASVTAAEFGVEVA